MSVDVGELMPLGITVRAPGPNADTPGPPMNAEAVTLTITRPDLTTFSPQIANPPGEIGQYIYDYVPTLAGPYHYRWQTTNPTLVLTGTFHATGADYTGLVDVARMKRTFRIGPTDYEHDDDLRDTIRAATAAMENETGRVLSRRTLRETHRVSRGRRSFVVNRRPVIDIVSVSLLDSGVVLTPPAISIDEHGIVECDRYLHGRVVVEYGAGPSGPVPPNVMLATEYVVQHLWNLRTGSSARPQPGGRAGDAPSELGYSIPNRARDLLGRMPPMVR